MIFVVTGMPQQWVRECQQLAGLDAPYAATVTDLV